MAQWFIMQPVKKITFKILISYPVWIQALYWSNFQLFPWAWNNAIAQDWLNNGLNKKELYKFSRVALKDKQIV